MRYPLFLCDFDGTLVRDDGTVTKKNIDAIARYKQAGGKFVIVTGRMLASIRQRLNELGLHDGVVVAYQGAMVADIATGKILKDGSSPCDEILPAVRFMEKKGWHVQVYVGDRLYSSDGGPLLAMYEKVCRVKGTVLPSVSAFLEREKMPVTKALAICDPKEQENIHRELFEELGEEKFFIADSAPYLVEIIPKEQSKGAAVKFLSDHYGVPYENIAAIGDQGTDLPMIEPVGGRFAVENAVPAIKNIARVVPSVDDDGVSFALEIAMGERK